MGQQFRNIVYCADRSGTAKWRKIWPIQSIDCIAQQLNMQVDYSQTPILDQNYYNGLTSVTVQRWISDQHRDIMLKFLKPLCEAKSFAVIFEEDDEMFDGTLLNESKREFLEKKYGDLIQNSIPLYNRGRRAFEGEHVQSNIKAMLNAADFVTVTTDYLKEIYHDFYDVPLENIIAVPNLLPKYLFGDRYEPEKKLKQFSQNKAKPRVGIVSSLSHFNVDNVRQDKDGKAVREVKQKDGTSKWMREDNVEVKLEDTVKITDDFDDIADMVRATVNDFQWVCFGYCPPQIADLAKAGKVEVHSGVAIMNYASKLENLNLQAVVAPIKKMAFNYSKSFIKTMECAALGIPLFATNCLPYSRVMDRSQLFDTQEELKEKLLKLKLSSSKIYTDIIDRQWRWLNSPCHEGDFDLHNFWLEDNLNVHIDLFKMRQKPLNVSLAVFAKQYEARKAQEKANTIFKNDQILITK